MADIVSRYRLFKPYNQFDDTAVCKSCNDDLLSEKFYPKSSSIGGRKISPQKLFKSIADTMAWVVPQFGIATMRYCELKLPTKRKEVIC